MTHTENVLLGMAVEASELHGRPLDFRRPGGLALPPALVRAANDERWRFYQRDTDGLLALLADLGVEVRMPSEEDVRIAADDIPSGRRAALAYMRSLPPLLLARLLDGAS